MREQPVGLEEAPELLDLEPLARVVLPVDLRAGEVDYLVGAWYLPGRPPLAVAVERQEQGRHPSRRQHPGAGDVAQVLDHRAEFGASGSAQAPKRGIGSPHAGDVARVRRGRNAPPLAERGEVSDQIHPAGVRDCPRRVSDDRRRCGRPRGERLRLGRDVAIAPEHEHLGRPARGRVSQSPYCPGRNQACEHTLRQGRSV